MCSKTLAKFLLVIFNIGFFIIGGVFLGLGVFTKLQGAKIASYLSAVPGVGEEIGELIDIDALLTSASMGMIVAGAFIFGLATLGCCGALKELQVFLIVYAAIVGAILTAQVAAGVLFFVLSDKVEGKILDFLTSTIEEDYGNGFGFDESGDMVIPSDVITLAWDVVQVTLECCGADNYTNFALLAENWDFMYNVTVGGVMTSLEAEVPLSCCKMNDSSKFPGSPDEIAFTDVTGCLQNPSEENANLDGCYYVLKEKIPVYARKILIVLSVVAALEITGIVSAIYLCRTVGRGR